MCLEQNRNSGIVTTSSQPVQPVDETEHTRALGIRIEGMSGDMLSVLRALYSLVIMSGFHPEDLGSNPSARTKLHVMDKY